MCDSNELSLLEPKPEPSLTEEHSPSPPPTGYYQQQSPFFWKLPLEIRQKIYAECAPSRKEYQRRIHVSGSPTRVPFYQHLFDPFMPSSIQPQPFAPTCKRMRDEAQPWVFWEVDARYANAKSTTLDVGAVPGTKADQVRSLIVMAQVPARRWFWEEMACLVEALPEVRIITLWGDRAENIAYGGDKLTSLRMVFSQAKKLEVFEYRASYRDEWMEELVEMAREHGVKLVVKGRRVVD